MPSAENAHRGTASEVEVGTGGIDIADFRGLPMPEGVRAKLSNGPAEVEVRLIDFNGSFRISRLRVRPRKADPALGRKLGTVSVDLGRVVVADFKALSHSLTPEELDELNDLAPDCEIGIGGIGELKFESLTVRFAACQSGFGDGRYSVFSLNAKGRPAGLEIEFIKDGHVL